MPRLMGVVSLVLLVAFSGITTGERALASLVFINEIHYDNVGTDTGEAIEVAGPSGTDLTGWSIALYNGANGSLYSTTSLSGVIPNTPLFTYGTVALSYPTNGIQNGSPDGIALVDNTNAVVQFLSYEGSFAAVDGPAAGQSSMDIGVSENSTTSIGASLQLVGTGSQYSDFTWQNFATNTFGNVNSGQFFPATPSVLINEILASHTGIDDTEFVELYGTPGENLSGYSLIAVEGDLISSQGTIDWRLDLGAGDIIGDNGFFLIGNPTGLGANYGVAPNLDIGANTLENSSFTLALVLTSSLTGNSVAGTEIVLDALALYDGDFGDIAYFGAPVVGPDGAFFPAGARRIVDGLDTDTAADWVLADFFLGTANTPTAGIYRSVPEPATLALFGLGLASLGVAARRRKTH